jgi:hypothetical protein
MAAKLRKAQITPSERHGGEPGAPDRANLISTDIATLPAKSEFAVRPTNG